jgi:hypothetical protein
VELSDFRVHGGENFHSNAVLFGLRVE